MGRHIDPVCRLCRREGMKLFLKGDRCQGPKCSFARRESPPGVHPWQRRRLSDYGVRLREKQKVKRYYGVYETQYRRYFRNAERSPMPTGDGLLQTLERRLDNVLYRLGFALSRPHARQLIVHGHVQVGGRRVDRPGFAVKVGDKITPGSHEVSKKALKESVEARKDHAAPSWLKADPGKLVGEVLALPTRDEVPIEIQDQLVIEFSSR